MARMDFILLVRQLRDAALMQGRTLLLPPLQLLLLRLALTHGISSRLAIRLVIGLGLEYQAEPTMRCGLSRGRILFFSA